MEKKLKKWKKGQLAFQTGNPPIGYEKPLKSTDLSEDRVELNALKTFQVVIIALRRRFLLKMHR